MATRISAADRETILGRGYTAADMARFESDHATDDSHRALSAFSVQTPSSGGGSVAQPSATAATSAPPSLAGIESAVAGAGGGGGAAAPAGGGQGTVMRATGGEADPLGGFPMSALGAGGNGVGGAIESGEWQSPLRQGLGRRLYPQDSDVLASLGRRVY